MKRLLLLVLALVAGATIASAQPRALGIRAGWGTDVDYEHTIVNDNFMEFTLGMGFGLGETLTPYLSAAALYNFMIARPDWTPRGTWGFYAGPGAGVFFTRDWAAGGIVGDIGLEFTFWFPLQLSLDVRPALMFGNGGIRTDLIPNFALGVRYAF